MGQDVASVFHQGCEHLDEGPGAATKALDCFDLALEIDAEFTPAKLGRVFALSWLGQSRDAVDDLVVAAETVPGSDFTNVGSLPEVDSERLEAGERALEEGRTEEAIRIHSELAEAYPRLSHVWLFLGCAQLAAKDLEAALGSFVRATAWNPEEAMGWINLAFTLWQLREIERCQLCAQRALRFRPGDPKALMLAQNCSRAAAVGPATAERVRSIEQQCELAQLMGRMTDAAKLALEMESAAFMAGDPESAARVQRVQGILLARGEQWRRASGMLTAAIEAFRELDLPKELVTALLSLANVRKRSGGGEPCDELYDEAERVARASEVPGLIDAVMGQRGVGSPDEPAGSRKGGWWRRWTKR